MTDLSLFDIEAGLHDLVTAWQEAPDAEQQAAAEVAIRGFVEAEVRKVDGLRKYIKSCDAMAEAAKAEAQAQQRRASMWTARKERIKAFVFDVMNQFGVKKLEGQTGSLLIKGNGGKQALVVSDESMVPDELCVWAGEIDGRIWKSIELLVPVLVAPRMVRQPNKAAISAALDRGEAVAGCYLQERATHLEVK